MASPALSARALSAVRTGLVTDAPAGHPTVRQPREQGVSVIQA